MNTLRIKSKIYCSSVYFNKKGNSEKKKKRKETQEPFSPSSGDVQ